MDIDIDVNDRDKLVSKLNCIPAANKNLKGRHIVGVHYQNIPYDPLNDMSMIPYDVAETIGYGKIDILNLKLLSCFSSEDELNYYLSKSPRWELLEDRKFVEKLFHIHDHFDIVSRIKPKSIEDLAIVLALIRPSKKYLRNKSMDMIKKYIWAKEDNEDFSFKRSHAYGYALNIILQMNYLSEKNHFS